MDTLPSEATTRDESDHDDQADIRFIRGLLIALGIGAVVWVTVVVLLLVT